MATKTPQEIAEAAVDTGATKAKLGWDKALVGGFLAGAYIAFGGLVAIAVSSGLNPEVWGTLPTLFAGTVFALGLVLVVLAGSELLTGNMALVPIAMMRDKVGLKHLGMNFTIVLIAAAACEMHPAAVVKGTELASIAARLDAATAQAAAAGVLDVPAIVTAGGRVFHGDRELEAAAGAAAS